MSKDSNRSQTSTLFRSVYVPDYTPSEGELLRGQAGYEAAHTKTMADIKKEVEEKVAEIGSLINGDFFKPGYNEPRPLTVDEGKAAMNDRKKLLKDIERIKKKMSSLEDSLDQRLGSESAASFTYSFKKRPRLRKAMRVITGKAKNNITYEDYKKALAIKERLEMEDSEAFFERTED